ncbi:pentatricopeptide repeat domain-containing protein 3, mitochondrial [Betta splendens]|uniref:Small ribosomal subunit protein mS39 n=1 Tax=Betta splendens TaxID=158456 RepID=A0A6P7NTK5_BETSP|nr:pentatricopeptide repeat domain-containing protein 3, mitochondrial [Betta splendens]
MAAPVRHVGHHIQRNSRLLLNNLEQLWIHRSFSWSPALQQQADQVNKDSAETIVIPKKKTWSKEAVLEALASTASRDATAYPYQFQDDSYLSPRTFNEFKLYTLSQESGRAAAKYFVNNNPNFFTKDFAEPHIPCLMPETVSLHLKEVSEEALKERINLRKVTAAVDMYDQLLQAGSAISMETTHDLLDLICLYCDRNPVEEGGPQTEETEESGAEAKKRKVRVGWASDLLKSTWKESNSAERIFKLLPEKDTRCYSALIRGMVKHGAYTEAFSMFTDLLNNRLSADVHIFNALISAVPDVRDKYNERLELLVELLKQMSQQKVQPNLLTFNSVLKALRHCGSLAKSQSLQTLNEMKTMGIAPSLATFDHMLAIFYKSANSAQSSTNILQEVMSEVTGCCFTCQDPDDVMFFSSAMRICLDTKDLEMGYRVQSLVEVGENWRLLGDPYQLTIYYCRFFNLLCMMEHIDMVLKWYRRLIPSLYYPNAQGLKDLLQALDTDNRLDLLPSIWKDIRSLGHEKKLDVIEDVLTLMTREKHSPKIQESFAQCALDVKSVFEGERGRLEWSTNALSNITSLLLRANKTQQAWEMLQLFKEKNRVPHNWLMNDFLSECHTDGSAQKAVDLVQLSAAFCLPATSKLAQRALAEFDLTEEQRVILSALESAGEPSD